MSGPLVVVAVIGVIVGLRIVLSLISAVTEKGIDLAGRAIGSAFSASAPQGAMSPQGVVALTRPSEEIRSQLVSVGALDLHDSCLTTSSGVAVELTVASGPPRFTCRWNSAVADKPTQIMADVLRAVRQVDPGAQVAL